MNAEQVNSNHSNLGENLPLHKTNIIQKFNFESLKEDEKILNTELKTRKASIQNTKVSHPFYDKSKDYTEIENRDFINKVLDPENKVLDPENKVLDPENKEYLANLDKKIKNLRNEIKEKKEKLGKGTEAARQDFEKEIQEIINNNKKSNSTFDENNQELKKQIENLQKMSFFSCSNHSPCCRWCSISFRHYWRSDCSWHRDFLHNLQNGR